MIRSVKHLNFVRSLDCYISDQTPSQACHIRILTDGGTGIKPSDYFVLPFTYQYHKMQSDIGELRFYQKFNINPFILAKNIIMLSNCLKVNNNEVKQILLERAKIYGNLYLENHLS
tara:strand:+ start:5611 stop:5958 length:348 start_codon:yes stop_codon:yes gene_type:complete